MIKKENLLQRLPQYKTACLLRKAVFFFLFPVFACILICSLLMAQPTFISRAFAQEKQDIYHVNTAFPSPETSAETSPENSANTNANTNVVTSDTEVVSPDSMDGNSSIETEQNIEQTIGEGTEQNSYKNSPENPHENSHGNSPEEKMPTGIAQDGKTLETNSAQPWYIYADELVSLNDGVVLEGHGNVLLVRGEDYLKADFARLYTNTQWIYLQGNVRAKLGADEMKATEAEFELTNSTGWVQNADIFMAGPHMYFTSRELYKEKGDVYTLKNAIVTVCDGEIPLWSLEAQSAKVEADAYASFNHPRFQIKNIPLLYSPYMVIPTKTTRQSGLLQPSYGISSRQGLYYSQPFFYVIDQSRDLTFYGTIFTERGVMPAIEYRSHTKSNQKTWLGLDVMYDTETVLVDTTSDTDYKDGKIRDNNFRFWLRGMGDGDILESPWQYKYNLDIVSDQNFLREFQNRMTGFEATQVSVYQMFGRDFEEDDANRVTEAYVFRDWQRLTVSAGIRYEQDPSLGNGNTAYSEDETVQQLPTVGVYWNKGPLFGWDNANNPFKLEKSGAFSLLPLNLEAAFTSTYMYRQEGTQGLRTELYPKLSMPVNFRYVNMEMSMGARALLYNNTRDDSTGLTGGTDNREEQISTASVIPDFGMDFYTEAKRTWEWPQELELFEENLGKKTYTAMRHTIQPRVSYSLVADVDQEDNPYYSVYDRIQDRNSIEFSFDNHFTFKRETVAKGPEGLYFKTSYHDLLRVRLSTGYDFREQDRTQFTEYFENRPLYDFRLLISTSPFDWLTFSGDTFYSPYDHEVTRFDGSVRLKHSRYGSLTTAYSVRESTYNYLNMVNYDNLADITSTSALEVITNTLHLNLTPKIFAYFKDVTAVDGWENYSRAVGLGYNHQCMRIYGAYTKDQTEESFHLNIEFTGLGL